MQNPDVIRHKTDHKIVPKISRQRTSRTKQNKRPWHFHQWVVGIDPNISCGPLTSSGLPGSPRALAESRNISSVAVFGYSGKGKWLPPTRTELHPSYFCMAIPSFEELGKMAFHLHPLSRD